MRWDDVLRALGQAAASDSIITSIHGQDIQMAGEIDKVLPGITFRLITDSQREQWEPCVTQWDVWCEEFSDVVTTERRLRQLFDVEEAIIQGVYMLSMFEDGIELGQGFVGPDRQLMYGRAVRFRHEPIRESLRSGRTS